MSLKEKLDITSIVNKNNIDVYKVLEKTQLFSTYQKTKKGLIEFYQKELHNENIKFKNSTFIIDIKHSFDIKYTAIDYLKILLLPLFHCSWDNEMKTIITDVLNNKASLNVISLAETLIPNKITLDMIPDDWRYLVEDLIKDKGLDITKFKTLKELETYVDETVIYASGSPEEYPSFQPPQEPILMEEEKEMIAKTFRLDPSEFNTKSEAMRLYEFRNGS